jgi:class 3 adenylate cyclase
VSKTKLASILFVEIADFAGLLERDERRALALLAAFRSVAESLAAEYEGEIVDATGEELLLVFESAVSAVQFALHLFLSAEAAAKAPSGAVPLVLRAGVHLGEIWRDEGRVYGNGINVAARVKEAASPGALLVSEDVERQISNKLDLELRELPGRELKNIERPLRIYEILTASRRREGPGTEASESSEPAPSRPSEEAVTARPAESRRAIPPASAAVEQPRQTFQDKGPGPQAGTDSRALVKERLKRLVLDSIDVKVKEGGRGFTLSIEPSPRRDGRREPVSSAKNGGAAAPKLPRPPVPPIPPGPPASPHTIDSAAKGLAKGARKFLFASALGGALGYAYASTGKWYFAAGAFAFGFLPALSGLKGMLTARLELRDARRADGRRITGRDAAAPSSRDRPR